MLQDSQALQRNFDALTAAGKRSYKINLENQNQLQTFGTSSTHNRSVQSVQMKNNAKKGSRLIKQIASGAYPRALRVLDPMNTYCNENILTLADHAGIKRASAVSPQPSGATQYVMRSPNVHNFRENIGFSPLTNATGSGKNGHVIVKQVKHTSKPAKTQVNPNQSQPAIKQRRQRNNANSISHKENFNQQHFTSVCLPHPHRASKESSGFEVLSTTSPSYTCNSLLTSGANLPPGTGNQAPLASANSRSGKHQRLGSFGFQSFSKQEEPQDYNRDQETELLKHQILELQNVIVSMSVIQQRQTMSQLQSISPATRFNPVRSMSPQNERHHRSTTNTRPKTSQHHTQASITSKATTKSKSQDRGTFSRAKRMVDVQAQTSETSSVDKMRFFQQTHTAQKSLKSLKSMNEDIDECCNLKIETISVPTLSTGKPRRKTPKIFKSVKKTKTTSISKKFNLSPTSSKTPEKQTTVKKRKVTKSRSRSRSAMSPTAQTTVTKNVKSTVQKKRKVKKRTSSALSEPNYMLQTIQSQNQNVNTMQPQCQKACELSRVIERSVNTSQITGGTHKSISPTLPPTKVALKNMRAQSTLVVPQNRKTHVTSKRSQSKNSNPSTFSNTLSPTNQVRKRKVKTRPVTQLSSQIKTKKSRQPSEQKKPIKSRTKSAPGLTKLKQRLILSEATPQRHSRYNSKNNSNCNSRSKSPLQQTSSFDLRGVNSKKKRKNSKVNSIVAEIARQIQKNYRVNQNNEYLLHDGRPMSAENLLNITMGGIPAIQQIQPTQPVRSVSRLSNKSKVPSVSAKSYKSSKHHSLITAQQMIAQIQDKEQTPITEQWQQTAHGAKQYHEDFQEEQDFYEEVQTSPSIQRDYKGSQNGQLTGPPAEQSSPSQPKVQKGEDSPVFCDDYTEQQHPILDYSSGQQVFRHYQSQAQESDEKTMSPFRSSPPKMHAFLAQTSSQKVLKTGQHVITFGSQVSPSRQNSSHIVSPSALKRLHAATGCPNCGVPKLALDQVFKQQKLDRITDKSRSSEVFTLHTVENQEQSVTIVCQQNQDQISYKDKASPIYEENSSSLYVNTENATSQTNSVHPAKGMVLERRSRQARSKNNDSIEQKVERTKEETPIFVRTMPANGENQLESGVCSSRQGRTLQSMQTNSPLKMHQHHIFMEDKRQRELSIEMEAAPSSNALNTINTSQNNLGTIASQITEAALQMSTIQHIGTNDAMHFVGTEDYPEQEYLVPQPYELEMRPSRCTSPNIMQYPRPNYQNIQSKVALRYLKNAKSKEHSPSFIQNYNYKAPQGKYKVPSHIVKKSRNRRDGTLTQKSVTLGGATNTSQIRTRFYPVPHLAPPSLYQDINIPARTTISPSPDTEGRRPRAYQSTVSQRAKLNIETKKKVRKSDQGLSRPISTKNSRNKKYSGGQNTPQLQLATAQQALKKLLLTSDRRSFASPTEISPASMQLKKKLLSCSSGIASSSGHGANLQREVYMFKSQCSNEEPIVKAQAQAFVDDFNQHYQQQQRDDHLQKTDGSKNGLYEPVLSSTAKKSTKKSQKFRPSSTISGNQHGRTRKNSSAEGSCERRMKTQEEIDIKIKESQSEIEKLRRFRDELLIKERELSTQNSNNTSPMGIFSAEMFPQASSNMEITQVMSKRTSANKKSVGNGAFNYVMDEHTAMSGLVSSGQTSKGLEHNSDFKDLEECRDLFKQSQTETQQILSKLPSLHHVDSATNSEVLDRNVGTGGTRGDGEDTDDIERAISDAVFVHEFANQETKQ